jgi:outer membrane protein assembly factor BamE (lipoprotein component of BamABCDE complex)
MKRLKLLAAFLIVSTLLQGCSIAIMESTKNERRAPTTLHVGMPRDAVEEQLGKPVQVGEGTNGDLGAVYHQRV